MAATGNEIVLLKQLQSLCDSIKKCYQPKGDYLTSVPEASTTAIGGVKIASDEDFKSFLGI